MPWDGCSTTSSEANASPECDCRGRVGPTTPFPRILRVLMTFPVEIILKGREFAVTTSVVVPSDEVPVWTDAMVHNMLVEILRAIDRTENPQAPPDREVVLRGFSWIVEPLDGQVVIAIEIPMGAAVAGPFDIGQTELDALISRAIRADRQLRSPDIVH